MNFAPAARNPGRWRPARNGGVDSKSATISANGASDVAAENNGSQSRWRKVVMDQGDKDEDMDKASSGARALQSPRPSKTASNGAVRSVCVVGGGPSGLACCRALCDHGLQVTLVQESRGLGGKLCTKFVNGKEDPTLHFDMGVQLLRPAGAFAQEIADIVEPWPREGRFKKVRCSGNWQRWRLDSTSDLPMDGLVVGVPSMSAIGRHLADKCKGLTMHTDRTAHVLGSNPRTGQWQMEWKREAATGGQLKYRPELADVPTEVGRGIFDAVVLAFEANKILRGCKSGYKMTHASATPEIKRQITGKAKTSQIWNLMVAFDTELAMPWDAATIEGHPALGWVAVDSSKPQRAKVPQCLMAFSTKEWANYKQWGKREVEVELLRELLDFLQQVLGRRPPKPSFVLSGRWGNNTETVLTGEKPQGEFPMCALGHYDKQAATVWDAVGCMGATGDWTRGFSASDAYSAGLEMGAAVLSESKQSASEEPEVDTEEQERRKKRQARFST